jgi:glycosyltransferase involved in cell wall biosynthesis
MNEEGSVGAVLEGVKRALGGAGWSHEIIVVDTNSQDRTVEIASDLGARVVLEPRRGYGRAYKTGFAQAQGDYIVTLDADTTYPPDKIPLLLQTLESGGYDFVSGDRMSTLAPQAMGLGHRVGNRLLTLTIRLLYRVRLRDSQSGMWAFRRSILPRLGLTADGMAFSEELKLEVHRNGLKFGEVPIPYGVRKGQAKIRSWADGWGNFRFLVWERFSPSRRRAAGNLPLMAEESPGEVDR